MDNFDLKKYIAENRLFEGEKLYDVYDDGDVIINLNKATPEQERLIKWEADPENGISEFGDSEDAQKFADSIMKLNSVEDVERYYSDVRGWDEDEDTEDLIQYAIEAWEGRQDVG